MLPAAATDPTQVVGARIGAYAIDVAISTAALLLAVVLVSPTLWDTQRVGSSRTAEATCWAFDEAAGRDPGAGGRYQRPEGDVADTSGRSLERDLCLANGDEIIWIDPLEIIVQVGLAVLLATGISFLNVVVLQSITGASLGKLCVGLRVVTEDGRRAAFWRMLVRQLVMIIDTAFASMVGLVCMLTSRGHQRVGDMAAGTYVVRSTSAGRPLEIPTVARRGWGPVVPAGPPPHPDGPHWDPHRQTWIRYDRSVQHWTMWDPARGEWREIDT